MKKIGIVLDSTVYIPQKMIDDNGIKVVSLNVVDGVDSYKETDVNVQFIFDKQDEGTHWTTSQPAPGEFLEAFQEFIADGCDRIYVVTLSKNISGTYQSATLAKNMLDTPDVVHIFDTHLCAYGTEMIALELIEMVNAKKSDEEVIERITGILSTSHQMFTVQNLFSLTKGGRLSVTRAAIGTVLRIKPVIRIIDGRLELVKSERTYKKIHDYFLREIRESLNGNTKLTFYVTSQFSLETSTMIKDLLQAEFPGCKLTFTEYLGPVFSIHVGRKGYGISWFSEK